MQFREDIILPIVKDKRVLDCGGVDHYAFEQKRASGDWLHEIIRGAAKDCVGTDILEENVKKMNSLGYNFLVCNAENMSFKNEFEVIMAGEIIEHVYNAGLFLDSCWRALVDGGKLIITTPNNTSLTSLIYVLLRGRELVHPEHTCYYSPTTLSYIVKRHGFKIDLAVVLPRKSKFSFIEYIRKILSKIFPLLADTLVIVATKLPTQEKYSGKW